MVCVLASACWALAIRAGHPLELIAVGAICPVPICVDNVATTTTALALLVRLWWCWWCGAGISRLARIGHSHSSCSTRCLALECYRISSQRCQECHERLPHDYHPCLWLIRCVPSSVWARCWAGSGAGGGSTNRLTHSSVRAVLAIHRRIGRFSSGSGFSSAVPAVHHPMAMQTRAMMSVLRSIVIFHVLRSEWHRHQPVAMVKVAKSKPVNGADSE